MKLKTLLTISAIALAMFSPNTGASAIVYYDFTIDNTNQASSPLATAGNATAPWSGNFMGNVTSGAFRDTTNSLIADNFADALLTNRYVTFTVTPNEAIDFQTFEVTLGGFNTTGTDYNVGLGVFSELTGFNVGGILGSDELLVPAGTGGIIDKATPLSIDLSQVSLLQSISDPVEFRVYYIDDRATDHSGFNVRTRDISVEATAIPEPTTTAVLAGLLAVAFVLRRRLAKVSR